MPASVHRLPTRRHPRVPFSSTIAVQVPDWSALSARGLDLSYGGLSLILPERLALGDKLVFGLALPDGKPLEVEAVVRNVVRLAANRFRVGLQWAGLAEEAGNELRLFVDRVATAAA